MPIKSSHPVRVITCCYCGARSTLPTRTAHRLICHGCGAPVRLIETLQPEAERRPRRPGAPKPAVPHPADRPGHHLPKDRPSRRRKGKRRKGFFTRVRDWADDWTDDLDDLFDLEDLIDEIFD